MADKTYDVGYGKPPAATRFAKGRSGNPAGRPRKVKATPTPLDAIFEEICGTATVQGQEKPVTGREAMYRGLVVAALKGSVRAAKTLLKELVELKVRVAAASGYNGPMSSMVLLVPAPVPVEEFEARAMAEQAKLIESMREDARLSAERNGRA